MTKPTALITGASRTVDIGAAVVRKLATGGWNIALSYWIPYDQRMPWGPHPLDVETLKRELETIGAQVVCIPADLELLQSAKEIFAKATEELCSGCGYKNDSLSLSDREWTCAACATHHLRDFNSAKNVKSEGLRFVAVGYPETLNACGLRVSLAEASIAG